MSLTYDETEQYLTIVFSGIRYVDISDTTLLFKFPSNEIKLRAQMVYQKSFNEAVKGGMLPMAQLEELIEKRNLISKEEIAKLSKLRSQLEAQEILLGKTSRVKANQERIKQVINRIKTDINQIEYKKNSKLLMSAETKAEEERTFFVCSQCVFREDGSLLWSSYAEAKKERDLEFREKVLIDYMRFYSGLPVRIIRELARNGLWRIRYISSMKTSDPLFGVPTSCYTTDQFNLAYWSNFYQNIYDMSSDDRPSDIVIDDDDALDAFLKAFYEERTRQEAASRSKSKRSGKLSAFDAEEVIVTSSHELYQDIPYDKPREAQKLKDRVDIKKRTKRG